MINTKLADELTALADDLARDKLFHGGVVQISEGLYFRILAALTARSDGWREGEFLVARVSQDGHEVGIDHPTEAPWKDVLRAHISLRDRLNERLAEKDLCPFKPSNLTPPESTP